MKKKRIIVAFFMILLCTMAIGMSAFAEETTLKNKKWVTGQGAYFVDTDNDGVADKWQDNGDIYYKINVPKTGIIKVQVKVSDAPGAEEYYGYDPGDSYDENKITFVDLLDAQKETYNNSFWDSQDYKSSDLMIEPVKKGIYYLKVHGDEKYQICYTFKAVGKLSKAGTSGSNAVKLVAGKTVKRFLSQNSKKKGFL